MSELIFGEQFYPDYTCYWVKNSLGGVHIWYKEQPVDFQHWGRFYGGIEIHSPVQLYDFAPEPTHSECWLLGCPCYHDGSSFYFTERIAPLIDSDGKLPLALARSILTDWHQSKFGASS